MKHRSLRLSFLFTFLDFLTHDSLPTAKFLLRSLYFSRGVAHITPYFIDLAFLLPPQGVIPASTWHGPCALFVKFLSRALLARQLTNPWHVVLLEEYQGFSRPLADCVTKAKSLFVRVCFLLNFVCSINLSEAYRCTVRRSVFVISFTLVWL